MIKDILKGLFIIWVFASMVEIIMLFIYSFGVAEDLLRVILMPYILCYGFAFVASFLFGLIFGARYLIKKIVGCDIIETDGQI